MSWPWPILGLCLLGVKGRPHFQAILSGPIAEALAQFHRVVTVLDLSKPDRHIDVTVAEDLESMGDEFGV